MSFPLPRTLVISLAASSWLLLSGCGGSSDSPTPAAATCEDQALVSTSTYTELWTKVFKGNCGTCHGGGDDIRLQGGPDLQDTNSFYTSLVGKTGAAYPDWAVYQSRAACVALQFIKPSDAAHSTVVAAFDQSVVSCQTLYHIGPPLKVCISTANLGKLKEWINAGAQR